MSFTGFEGFWLPFQLYTTITTKQEKAKVDDDDNSSFL